MLVVLCAARCEAGNIWDWTHDASGSGTSNVVDGGPLEIGSQTTVDNQDSGMGFGALDSTGQGSLSADAAGTGRSRISNVTDEQIQISVDLTAGYFASPFPGGDNPGGMAEAELFSVIEFTMPVDKLHWGYSLTIFEDAPFVGETYVLVENITQSQVLLTLDQDTDSVQTILSGTQGDRIRITTDMSGYGTTPGGIREYLARQNMIFQIPKTDTPSATRNDQTIPAEGRTASLDRMFSLDCLSAYQVTRR